MKYITNIYSIILLPGKQVLFSCFMGFIGIIITVHSVTSNTLCGTMAVNRNELFRLFYQPSGIFFYQSAGYHDLVSASLAFQAEICSHPQNFPFIAAARMGFFHFYDISYIKSICHRCYSSTVSSLISTPCTRKRSSSLTLVQVDRLTILSVLSTDTPVSYSELFLHI